MSTSRAAKTAFLILIVALAAPVASSVSAEGCWWPSSKLETCLNVCGGDCSQCKKSVRVWCPENVGPESTPESTQCQLGRQCWVVNLGPSTMRMYECSKKCAAGRSFIDQPAALYFDVVAQERLLDAAVASFVLSDVKSQRSQCIQRWWSEDPTAASNELVALMSLHKDRETSTVALLEEIARRKCGEE